MRGYFPMKKAIFTSLAAACVLAMPAQATVLTINPILATWSNVVGGASVNFSGNGTSNATVRWGQGGTNQSGYNFTSAAAPLNTNFVVNGGGSFFTLGDFTHFNQPINAGTSITGTRLTINYGVFLGANNLGNYNAVFNFIHEETPNGANPCAYGGANNQGVNINGCADRVTLALNSGLTQFFNIDGVNYSLELTGFKVGSLPFSQFLTKEGLNNTAQLRGRISAESVIGTGGEVPEPQSWAMMLFGFGAVGIAARRRRTAVDA